LNAHVGARRRKSGYIRPANASSHTLVSIPLKKLGRWNFSFGACMRSSGRVQLLRVIQEKRFKRVGGNTWHDTDFRLLQPPIATYGPRSRPGARARRFRRDLYYRLAVWTIELPPLRDRPEDILPLAEHFLAETNGTSGSPTLTPAVRAYLLERPYPGNIRDLHQLCRQIKGRHTGNGTYTAGDIPAPPTNGHAGDWQTGPFEQGIHRALEAGAALKDITTAAAETAVRLALEDGARARPWRRNGCR
jgi:transcriptional regulator with PAS, ATPase and Fis domain